jgi:hypothetical protein
MDAKGQGGIAVIKEGFCKSCSILAGRFDLTYADNSKAGPADGVYIHHFVSYDTGKSAQNPIGSSCAGGSAASGPRTQTFAAFVDRGEDSGETDTIFTSPDGKRNSGFRFTPKTSLMIQYDLVNYKEAAKDIYLNMEIEYIEGAAAQDAGHDLKSVSPPLPTTFLQHHY